MKQLFCSLALVLLALPAPASARARDESRVCDLGTLISAKPMNGAASTLTIDLGPTTTCALSSATNATTKTTDTVRVAGFKRLVLVVDYTHATSDDVVSTHLVGFVTADATPGECSSTSGGICESAGTGVTHYAVTGDIVRSMRYNIRGYAMHNIIFSHATAAAGDILTVTGYLTDD